MAQVFYGNALLPFAYFAVQRSGMVTMEEDFGGAREPLRQNRHADRLSVANPTCALRVPVARELPDPLTTDDLRSALLWRMQGLLKYEAACGTPRAMRRLEGRRDRESHRQGIRRMSC